MRDILCRCVADSDTRPPPIIYHGPQNQTLPVGNPAMLPCLASGEPAPSIVWLKGNAALTTHDPRITVLESGTLEIKGKHVSFIRVNSNLIYALLFV